MKTKIGLWLKTVNNQSNVSHGGATTLCFLWVVATLRFAEMPRRFAKSDFLARSNFARNPESSGRRRNVESRSRCYAEDNGEEKWLSHNIFLLIVFFAWTLCGPLREINPGLFLFTYGAMFKCYAGIRGEPEWFSHNIFFVYYFLCVNSLRSFAWNQSWIFSSHVTAQRFFERISCEY